MKTYKKHALAAFLLGFLAVQVFGAEAISIGRAATGIDESSYVRIGGMEQWLQIRGDDRSNPILFWLNGGPGGSTVPSTILYKPWERYFTMVMWDQRGEGKTFEKYGESGSTEMTVDRMCSDGLEVARYLKQHLPNRGIILLGHSWGSILGIHMILRQPSLFSAYVGTGQVINLHRQLEAGYPRLCQRAATNAEARQELGKIGPPPWKSNQGYDLVNKWAGRLDPPRKVTPPILVGYDPRLEPHYLQLGAEFSVRALFPAIIDEDMLRLSKHFEVPVIFIQGNEDCLTATLAVKTYFDEITAPKKIFIALPEAGHLAIFRDTDAFLAALVTQVRPIAVTK